MKHWPTILLVENDPNGAYFFERALRDNSIPGHLQHVSDGNTAIDYLEGEGHFSNRETHPLPGLVVLDLCTRGLGGMALLRWIRKKNCLQGLPVVIYSGSDHYRAVTEAIENGADIFIQKECGVKGLVRWLEKADLSWIAGPCSS